MARQCETTRPMAKARNGAAPMRNRVPVFAGYVDRKKAAASNAWRPMPHRSASSPIGASRNAGPRSPWRRLPRTVTSSGICHGDFNSSGPICSRLYPSSKEIRTLGFGK